MNGYHMIKTFEITRKEATGYLLPVGFKPFAAFAIPGTQKIAIVTRKFHDVDSTRGRDKATSCGREVCPPTSDCQVCR